MAKVNPTSTDVLFIGECGSGKSSTINNLLGREMCKTGKTFCMKGITREMKPYSGKWKRIVASGSKKVVGNENKTQSDQDFTEKDTKKDTSLDISRDTKMSKDKQGCQRSLPHVSKREGKLANNNEDDETTAGPKETKLLKAHKADGNPTKTKTMSKESTDEINLYDSPIFEETIAEIRSTDKKFHAIVLVFPMTRYTEDRRRFLEKIYEEFGENLFNFIIIIFTKTEDLEDRVKDEIKEVAKVDKIFEKFISGSNERYIVCEGGLRKDNEKTKFREIFYEKLRSILNQNKGCVYPSKPSKHLSLGKYLPKISFSMNT